MTPSKLLHATRIVFLSDGEEFGIDVTEAYLWPNGWVTYVSADGHRATVPAHAVVEITESVEPMSDSSRSELCDFIPTPEMHGEVVCQRCGSEEHGGDVDYSGCADCREPAERLEGRFQ